MFGLLLKWLKLRLVYTSSGGLEIVTDVTTVVGREVCAECNGLFETDSMIAHQGLHVCARCKPIFLQKVAEGAVVVPKVAKGIAIWELLLGIIVAAIILAPLVPVSSTHYDKSHYNK